MNTEQKDISLTDEDAENVVAGRAVRTKSQKSRPGYVPAIPVSSSPPRAGWLATPA